MNHIRLLKTLLDVMFFAPETKTILPNSVASISLEMIWAIPSGYYGNFFSRSGLLIEHFITVEAGLIDSDFRGDIKVLLFDHHPEKLLLFVLVIEFLRLFLWKNLTLIFKG